MKRFAAIFITLALLFTCIAGCAEAPEADTGKLSIVCTIFPQYDWVRRILGDRADDFELTLLLDSRIDLHNFQPSVDDIVKISTADLFIYVGGESDEWVEDALEQAVNEDMIVINLLEELGDAAKEEELLEGMEDDDDHSHDDEDEDDHDDDDHSHDDEDDHDDDEHAHDHEREYDEHVWLSLRNAQTFCYAIADALITKLDPGNAGQYTENLTAYIEKLSDLDARYQAVADAAPVKTLLFGDRFPFRYLMDDYGLTPYAAFSGCSAETEASFETIVFLAGKVDELDLNSIIVTESSDKAIAQTIISNTRGRNQQIFVLDAMQSVTLDDVQNGITYLSIMENNLRTLEEALQ